MESPSIASSKGVSHDDRRMRYPSDAPSTLMPQRVARASDGVGSRSRFIIRFTRGWKSLSSTRTQKGKPTEHLEWAQERCGGKPMSNKHQPSDLALATRPTWEDSSIFHQHGEAFCSQLQLIACWGLEASRCGQKLSRERFSTRGRSRECICTESEDDQESCDDRRKPQAVDIPKSSSVFQVELPLTYIVFCVKFE